MRLVAMAFALVVVVGTAVFGAILSQRTSVPIASPAPAQAAPDPKPRTVVKTIEEPAAAPIATTAMKLPSASDAAPVANPPGASTLLAQSAAPPPVELVI